MKLYNSMPATGSTASKTGAAALATAHYFLYELSHWRAVMLFKTAHCVKRRRVFMIRISKNLKESRIKLRAPNDGDCSSSCLEQVAISEQFHSKIGHSLA
jgi:hypothetical protein